jgi:hypothetical protein
MYGDVLTLGYRPIIYKCCLLMFDLWFSRLKYKILLSPHFYLSVSIYTCNIWAFVRSLLVVSAKNGNSNSYISHQILLLPYFWICSFMKVEIACPMQWKCIWAGRLARSLAASLRRSVLCNDARCDRILCVLSWQPWLDGVRILNDSAQTVALFNRDDMWSSQKIWSLKCKVLAGPHQDEELH